MGRSLAINSLFRNRCAVSVQTIIFDTSKSLWILSIRSARVGAADKIIICTIEPEVTITFSSAFRGNFDIIDARAHSFNPGDIEMSATLSDLVSNGDGAVCHREDCD